MSSHYGYLNRQLDMESARFTAPYEPARRRVSFVEPVSPTTSDDAPPPSYDSIYSRRSNSVGSSSSSIGPQRVRTRSIGFGAGVVFERSPGMPPSDDDLIVATVKLSPRRKSAANGVDELPTRPPARSFLRRMSTRFGSHDTDQIKAVKMPRRDYKRFFARDSNGVYKGTEPEREWGEEDLMREFGAYQDLPLKQILC